MSALVSLLKKDLMRFPFHKTCIRLLLLPFCLTWFFAAPKALSQERIHTIRPPITPDGKPVEVQVGIQFLSIYAIDSRSESFDADLYFWANWKDPRGAKLLTPEPIDHDIISREAAWGGEQKLWNPYLEMNTSSLASQEREVITIYKNGKVQYGTRIVGQFRPPEGTMNFRMFPFDSHRLQVEASSFVYNSSEVVFRPDQELIEGNKMSSVAERVRMQEWKIKECNLIKQDESFIGDNADETFSVLKFELYVVRKSSYYILRWIVPLLLILCLAWLALFTPVGRLDVQASTVSAAFLSLVALNFVVATDLPHCEYLTLFDHGLVIAYIAVLIIGIIVFRVSQLPEDVGTKLFARSRRTMPLAILIMNGAGAYLFQTKAPDRLTITCDAVIFLIWAAYIAIPFFGHLKDKRKH